MYQGEPGEEFGGRLTLTHGVDPSMKQRFAQGDDEAEGQDVLCAFRTTEITYDRDTDPPADSPPNSLETDSPRPIFTPAEQNTGTTPGIVPSFADFLSSTQMATAAPPKPPQKNATNHGSTLSFKRVTASFMGFRSTKSRGKASTLPNLPPTEADEWGVAKSPHSTRF